MKLPCACPRRAASNDAIPRESRARDASTSPAAPPTRWSPSARRSRTAGPRRRASASSRCSARRRCGPCRLARSAAGEAQPARGRLPRPPSQSGAVASARGDDPASRGRGRPGRRAAAPIPPSLGDRGCSLAQPLDPRRRRQPARAPPALIVDSGGPRPTCRRRPGRLGTTTSPAASAASAAGRHGDADDEPDQTTVTQGTLIPAVLETAINTDVPGYVRAVVSQDVRSFDGSRVLVPRSSRLIGQYQSGLQAGRSAPTSSGRG